MRSDLLAPPKFDFVTIYKFFFRFLDIFFIVPALYLLCVNFGTITSMKISRREWPLLVVGDMAALILSLYIALLVRYVEVPSWELYYLHLVPFSVLFVVSIFLFFIAGLYEKHTSFFKNALPGTVVGAQTFNTILAASFFFLIPYFGITPKTNLIIFLVFSSLLIVWWRLVVFPLFEFKNRNKAIIVGVGKDLEEMVDEINTNNSYRFECVEVIDISKNQNPEVIQKKILACLAKGEVDVVVADTHGADSGILLSIFYNLTFIQSGAQMVNFGKLYEEIFNKVPLSQLSNNQFLENFETNQHVLYELVKRVIDLFFSAVISFVLILVTPFVYIAIRLEDPGPLFIRQERVGKNRKKIHVYKFRTMTAVEHSSWIGETQNKVTTVGAFLRRTSIDELPQVTAVLRGDLSFIGPRSDVSGLAERLAEAIPFYNMRYKTTPGISGWAQINQRYTPGHISPQSIEESRIRLAYDLYYIKHRSLLLDLSIALRTIKTLFVRLIPHRKHGK